MPVRRWQAEAMRLDIIISPNAFLAGRRIAPEPERRLYSTAVPGDSKDVQAYFAMNAMKSFFTIRSSCRPTWCGLRTWQSLSGSPSLKNPPTGQRSRGVSGCSRKPFLRGLTSSPGNKRSNNRGLDRRGNSRHVSLGALLPSAFAARERPEACGGPHRRFRPADIRKQTCLVHRRRAGYRVRANGSG